VPTLLYRVLMKVFGMAHSSPRAPFADIHMGEQAASAPRLTSGTQLHAERVGCTRRSIASRVPQPEIRREPRVLKVGDKVKHRSRPDVGIGEIIEIAGNGRCTVEFSSCTFSGTSLVSLSTIEQIESERRADEDELKKQQRLIEQQQLERVNALQEQERRKHALEEQRKHKEFIARGKARECARKKIVEQFARYSVGSLWHITHKDNIPQILRQGILNHYDAHRLKANRVDISDPDAQRWRERFEEHYNRRVHEYVPLYIKPKNPMLYVRRHLQRDLCLLQISLSVMAENEYLITDGNAASHATKFFQSVESIGYLPWDVLNDRYWSEHDDGKRRMCAEVLIHPEVTPHHIEGVHCYSMKTVSILAASGCDAKLSSNLFF
jgi:hypothetical protein